jgi:hypothetical protein
MLVPEPLVTVITAIANTARRIAVATRTATNRRTLPGWGRLRVCIDFVSFVLGPVSPA